MWRFGVGIISLRQLLDYAAENHFALPAFNVNNLEQVRAIMQAASAANSPVILQASYGARKYAGPIFIKKMLILMEQYFGISTL